MNILFCCIISLLAHAVVAEPAATFKLRADTSHELPAVKELGFVTLIGGKDLKFDFHNETYATQNSTRTFIGQMNNREKGKVEDVLLRQTEEYKNRPGYLRLFAQDIYNFPIDEGYWRPPPHQKDIKRTIPSLGHHNRFYTVTISRFPDSLDKSCVYQSKTFPCQLYENWTIDKTEETVDGGGMVDRHWLGYLGKYQDTWVACKDWDAEGNLLDEGKYSRLTFSTLKLEQCTVPFRLEIVWQ
ncbi:hypothetical protein BJ508DRAFT_328602 [Ascobolus immersus RN42]|uniref:Uncharacterized protein n=1 Tax=Ascobolus immersus RN42 TaxID=1160509 RepID=A0A3N4HZA0_ASCIM|nr:hypothetical protein BJ508DRAFT_328602 [Ascobolus immersus RN42]